jgi:hypothetical protein
MNVRAKTDTRNKRRAAKALSANRRPGENPSRGAAGAFQADDAHEEFRIGQSTNDPDETWRFFAAANQIGWLMLDNTFGQSYLSWHTITKHAVAQNAPTTGRSTIP